MLKLLLMYWFLEWTQSQYDEFTLCDNFLSILKVFFFSLNIPAIFLN
jgi:hypothetical protein